MNVSPKTIQLEDIPEIISTGFSSRDAVTCYVGSNAATPTASIEALTEAVKSGAQRLSYLKRVHILLQGPVPYVEDGLQDRIMTYSIFSSGPVRDAANKGHAFYLPCTLANLDGLIDRGQKYEPD